MPALHVRQFSTPYVFCDITNSWPEIACLVAQLVKVLGETFENSRTRLINKVNDIVEHLKSYDDITLRYKKIDKKSIRTVV